MNLLPNDRPPTGPTPSTSKPTRARRGHQPVVRTPASREAKQAAAAVLDVLAGGRTPVEAASALGVSLTRYYVLEERALAGLVQACEPRGKGKGVNPERQRQQLERECERWKQACARQ